MCSVGSWLWLSFIVAENFKWQVTWGKRFDSLGTYLHLPDQGFQPHSTLIFSNFCSFYFHTRELNTTQYTTRFTRTRSSSGWWWSILTLRTRLESDGRNITTLQHTTRRILGASGRCESRLLKITKERSSSSLRWQVVNNLTCAIRLIPLTVAWQRSLSAYLRHLSLAIINSMQMTISSVSATVFRFRKHASGSRHLK